MLGRPIHRGERDRLTPGRRRPSDPRIWACLLLTAALLAGACGPAAEARRAPAVQPQASFSWTTFGGNPAHLSVNLTEAAIDAASVRRLRRIWSVELSDLADERPVLAGGLLMPDKQRHDVIYVTTDNGTLVALDSATGARFWAVTPKSDNPKYTKSSPAVDVDRQLVYSYGLDGSVHRFKATTGQEMRGSGWPVTVTRMPVSEKVSSALNLINGYLYVTTASFSGDAPPYQGHLVTIDVKTGATHVINSLCNDHTHLLAPNECKANGGGIWARPGVIQDPITGNILFTVSDGEFTANRKGQSWGDTVIEMTPDGSKVLDSYTPQNFVEEAFQNRDLGSVAPTLLPTIPESKTPLLAVQGGKEGLLRLLNRLDLSGRGGPAHVGGELQTVTLPDQCPTLAQTVAWKDPAVADVWVFVATMCHMDAFRVVTSRQGVTKLQPAWYLGVQATSPMVSGGVLFAASSESLLAIDPRTGRQLWSSDAETAGGTIGHVHWESPVAGGGRVYCSDEGNHLNAYAIASS